MNTMNIPGFTAEAALSKVSERYQKAAVAVIPSTASIVPSGGSCCAPCGKDLCCDECPPTGGDNGHPDPPDDHRRFQVFRFRMLM